MEFNPYLTLMHSNYLGDFLAVQWLGLHASTAGDIGLIPGWGIKIPPAATWPQNNDSFF